MRESLDVHFNLTTDSVLGGCQVTSCAEFERNATTMPASTASRGSPILQHISATKKLLQDVTIDVRYVWSGEIYCVGGLRIVFAGSRRPWIKPRSNERVNRMEGLWLTRVVF